MGKVKLKVYKTLVSQIQDKYCLGRTGDDEMAIWKLILKEQGKRCPLLSAGQLSYSKVLEKFPALWRDPFSLFSGYCNV